MCYPITILVNAIIIMMSSIYGGSLGYSPAVVFGVGALGAILMIIVVFLKGLALWHAARRSEKWWFIILLVVNTVGILELIYLYVVVGKWHKFKNNGTPPSNPNTNNSN